ncbi:hypothetical protein RclHR1_02260016 [Rhizophagus clarus]|uniref:Transmembrane protein n=1 Tax=Rhizophagus clarus TaxID=94130 RepID=A0A2Z6RAG1_9GLOM|nr:hypothetical protein RclHR1_02260016 [Rhizophagus clarus]GES90728.1 hypothetical protein GLOIN_2v1475678 [Rhizophagus clarus]
MQFLIDSICNYRSTEPVWFRVCRCFVAVIFTIIFIIFLSVQLNEIDPNFVTITKSIKLDGFNLEVTICSENSEFSTNIMVPGQNGINQPSQPGRCQDVTLQYQYPQFEQYLERKQSLHLEQNPQFKTSIWLNISAITPNPTFNNSDTPLYSNILDMFEFPEFNIQDYSKSDNLISLSFRSFQFHDLLNADIYYNEEIFAENSNFFILEPSYFLLYPGQAYFITLHPTVVFGDCSFHDYRCVDKNLTLYRKLELNPQLIQLPVNLNPNEINFGMRPHSRYYTHEVKNPGYNYTDLLADLGGFYTAVLGVFICFFGMQKIEPWGLAQKYVLSCIPCRKSFLRNLAKRYVSSAGIPLAEKVNERPANSSLEERVQILETLLKDYYLDDYYLDKIKMVKIKHRRLLEKYNKMELAEQNNDENSEQED